MGAFEFAEGDEQALADLCLRARKRAKTDPCFTPNQAADPKFSFRFGPFNCSLTLDAWGPHKQWHGSAACLQEVGTEPVQLQSGIIAQQPVEAIVHVGHWSDDEKKQADFLLGEIMGPFITGEKQQVVVTAALFATHWITDANF